MSEYHNPPPGQGPIDPRGAFSPPPPPLPGGPPAMSHYPGFHPGMYPPPRPHKSFTRAIFLTLATTIFGVSLLLNLYLLMWSGLSTSFSNRSNLHSVIVEGDPRQKIAVIPVSGIIMGDASARFDRFITRAEADPDVQALVIEIDSPGGSITASDEIHNRIARFRLNRPGVPIVSTMGSVATSGGYYVACATDAIYAQPTTMTGNIGVVAPRFNFHRLFDKWGIEETTLASSGTTFKNAGSMFKPEAADETAYLQHLIDQAFTQFKNVVRDARADKLTQPMEVVANGKVYMAAEALEMGLIDSIGYSLDAYGHAATLAGLTNQTVIRYQDPPTIRDLLMAHGAAGSLLEGSGAGGVTVNGVNINADLSQFHELTTPRLLYLWRGE
jgi:protease IV